MSASNYRAHLDSGDASQQLRALVSLCQLDCAESEELVPLLPSIVRLLRKDTVVLVPLYAAMSLVNLGKHRAAEIAAMDDALPALLELVQRRRIDDDTDISALTCLQILTALDAEARALAVRAGAIPVLKELVIDDRPQFQEQVLSTLNVILGASQDAKSDMCGTGAALVAIVGGAGMTTCRDKEAGLHLRESAFEAGQILIKMGVNEERVMKFVGRRVMSKCIKCDAESVCEACESCGAVRYCSAKCLEADAAAHEQECVMFSCM